MNVLTKSECCFCLISVARNVPSTQVNRDSTFQIHQRVTEKRKGFSQTTNTDGDRSPDVSDTRSHCRQSTRNQTTRVRTAFRVRGSDLLPECAECRTSLSARINQETRLVVGTDKELALVRVRGDGQHNTMRQVTMFRTAHVRGSTPQCAM